MKAERCTEYWICNWCREEMEDSPDFAIYFNKQNMVVHGINVNFCDDFHFCSDECMIEFFKNALERGQTIAKFGDDLNLQGYV